MKAYGGVDVQSHIFLTSALAGGEWSASRPGRFNPGKRAPGTHWIGDWVDPRASLDDVEKILDPTGNRTPPLGRPARSQSLYRLRYPGSNLKFRVLIDIQILRKVCYGLIFVKCKLIIWRSREIYNLLSIYSNDI
jgi:hypothetical protein